MERSKIGQGLLWSATLCIGSALTGMISAGEPSVFSVTVLLLGFLCIWGYVLFTDVHTTRMRLRVCVGIGLALLIVLPKPIVSYFTRSELRKTLTASIINSDGSVWEAIPNEEAIALKREWRGASSIIRDKFVEGKSYPLVLAIDHNARQASMWGYFTLWFKDTVAISFPQEQQEWRQEKRSRKPGYVEYRHDISQLYQNDAPRKLWPIPSFIFPTVEQYEFEYEIDASGQDYNEHSIDVGIVKGSFLIELHE